MQRTAATKTQTVPRLGNSDLHYWTQSLPTLQKLPYKLTQLDTGLGAHLEVFTDDWINQVNSSSSVLRATGIRKDIETCLLRQLKVWASEAQWHASMSAAEILQKHLGLIRQSKKMILKTILAKHHRTVKWCVPHSYQIFRIMHHKQIHWSCTKHLPD